MENEKVAIDMTPEDALLLDELPLGEVVEITYEQEEPEEPPVEDVEGGHEDENVEINDPINRFEDIENSETIEDVENVENVEEPEETENKLIGELIGIITELNERLQCLESAFYGATTLEEVAPQDARAYSKNVWDEATPITADRLNNMENGIASALPTTGGAMSGSITLPNSTNGQIRQTLTTGTVTPTLYITNGDNLKVGSADISNVCIYSKTNPKTTVNGSTHTLYHTGNKPTPADIGAMGISGPTFSGNLNQNGPGGKDWVYHINAERGTLNIAPKENGAPNWGKQIYIDRNGQMYCNGNRRVATINQENPTHYMIRYGSGMGGENGYITFSY